MTQKNIETTEELKDRLTSLTEDFDYMKQIVSHIDEHIGNKDSERMWMCNVSLQHLESRMRCLRYDVQELRRLLCDNGYLISPPWVEKKYLNDITRYVKG